MVMDLLSWVEELKIQFLLIMVLKGLFGNYHLPFFKWDNPYIYSLCNRKKSFYKFGIPLQTVVSIIKKKLVVVENRWGPISNTFESHECNKKVASTEGFGQVTSQSMCTVNICNL